MAERWQGKGDECSRQKETQDAKPRDQRVSPKTQKEEESKLTQLTCS
jgi:hypothetical protein